MGGLKVTRYYTPNGKLVAKQEVDGRYWVVVFGDNPVVNDCLVPIDAEYWEDVVETCEVVGKRDD